MRERNVLEGLVRLGVVGMVALGFRMAGYGGVAVVVAGVGLAVAALTLGFPGTVGRGIRRAERRLARAVGGLLSWALLTPFFLLVVTPYGLLTRRGRHDRLGRRPDPSASTYWRDRDRQPSLDEPY